MSKIRFGIVGTGAIAQTYAQVFQSSRLCKLVAAVDTKEEAARSFAEPFRASIFSDYRQLADRKLVDAVVIATPPNTHSRIAIDLMNRGIHILCEKPLCFSREDALRMIDAASKNKVTFTMASKFRYVADIIKAKSIVASGAIGRVLEFENYFTCCTDMSNRWNAEARISGGGVLIDNGTHSVDLIRYLCGEIQDVMAIETARVNELEVEESVRLIARVRGGVLALADLSWAIDKQIPDFVRIYGDNGTICIGWNRSRYKIKSSADWITFGNGYDKLKAFRAKVENFCRAIYGEEELLIKPEDALASVEVIEAAYRSLRRNLWEKVQKAQVSIH